MTRIILNRVIKQPACMNLHIRVYFERKKQVAGTDIQTIQVSHFINITHIGMHNVMKLVLFHHSSEKKSIARYKLRTET